MDVNLAKDTMSNKISNKRWTKENSSVTKNMRDLVTQDMERAKVLNSFFDSIFTSKCSSCVRCHQRLGE